MKTHSLNTLEGLRASLAETQEEIRRLEGPQWAVFAKEIHLERKHVPGYARTMKAQERYLKGRIELLEAKAKEGAQ